MKELVIPIKLDIKSLLRDLEQSSSQAGQSMGGLFSDITKMEAFTASIGVARDAVQVIGDTFRDASQHIRMMSDSFTQLQMKLRETAVLEGKKLDASFITKQIDIAAQTQFMTAADLATFRTVWNRMGSDYVGPGKNISQEMSDKIIPMIADYSKIKGVDPEISMKWLSSVVQNMPGASEDEIVKTWKQGFEIAKITRGSAAQTLSGLVPFTSANIGQGLPMGTGAPALLRSMKLYGAMQESFQGEAQTFLNDVVIAMTRMEISGKAKEMGITEDMTFEQKLQQVSEAWHKEDPEGKQFTRFIMGKMKGPGSAQAARGFQTLIMRGLQQGRLERWTKDIAGVEAADVPRETMETLDTELGKQMQAQARERRAQERTGVEFDPVTTELARTRAFLEEQGVFHEGLTTMNIYSKLASRLPTADYVEQPGLSQTQAYRVTQETMWRLAEQAFPKGAGARVEMEGYGISARSPQEEIKRLLDIIAKNTNVNAESSVRRENVPLTVKPPSPNERDMGGSW